MANSSAHEINLKVASHEAVRFAAEAYRRSAVLETLDNNNSILALPATADRSTRSYQQHREWISLREVPPPKSCTAASRNLTAIKKSFFAKGQTRTALGNGIEAFKGVFSSIRMTTTAGFKLRALIMAISLSLKCARTVVGPFFRFANKPSLSVNVDVVNGTFWTSSAPPFSKASAWIFNQGALGLVVRMDERPMGSRWSASAWPNCPLWPSTARMRAGAGLASTMRSLGRARYGCSTSNIKRECKRMAKLSIQATTVEADGIGDGP
ncbi:hypothetical protein IWZ01DRAFT_562162 [Phyllosticta capitalensis]